MNAIGGTIRDGKIVLDRPAEWPEGTRVYVQIYHEEGGLIEGVWPADGSPEGEAELARRWEEKEATQEPIDEEAAADFEAAIKSMREWFKPAGRDPGDKPT